MNKLKKSALSFWIVISVLTHFELRALAVSDSTKDGNIILAISFSEFVDDNARNNAGFLFGIQAGYGKEIFEGIYGRIACSYNFSNHMLRDYKVSMFDVGPQIEWCPVMKGKQYIWFGVGGRYRRVSATNKETKDGEERQGMGFAINFGWAARVRNTRRYFFLEGEYDHIKLAEDNQIGVMKLNAGIKF
jgi:hypothetical protein